MTELKVAVYYNSQSFYFALDKRKSMAENIQDICSENNIDGGDSWSLKLKVNTKHRTTESYYIEDLSIVPNGSELELVVSIPVKLQFIFGDYSNIAFGDLIDVYTDKLFLKNLVDRDHHFILQDYIAYYKNEENLRICLVTILNLLKNNLIHNIHEYTLEKLIETVKKCDIEAIRKRFVDRNSRPYVLEHSLSILTQLLLSRKCHVEHKEQICDIKVEHLAAMCRFRNVSFQFKPLKLLNTIVFAVKQEDREILLRKMDSRESKKILYENVVEDCVKFNDPITKELYVYQSHILSLLKYDLTEMADYEYMSKFDDIDVHENRLSDYIDFPENIEIGNKTRWNSTETVLSYTGQDKYRYSIQSQSSRDSVATIRTICYYPGDPDFKCLLTQKCLDYYSNVYSTTFNQSKSEEQGYQSKITTTAERIVKMLATILRIGSPIDKKKDDFQPLAFSVDLKGGFFRELFCRSMWLLSKTRREMQAQVSDDFDKVIRILEKQIRMVFRWKPMNLQDLLSRMKLITYRTVRENIEIETEASWKLNLDKNPCIQILKEQFAKNNFKLVHEQRLNFLLRGCQFPKLPEIKKKPQYFTVELSANHKNLLYYDCNMDIKRAHTPVLYDVTTIRHVITGKNCPHFKDHTVKDEKLIFSLQLEGEKYINFLTKDEKTANYWIDGFNLLLGKDARSVDYFTELKQLTEMDCALQLLELQNLVLPTEPPPIPPQPRPPVPPKLPHLKKQISQNRK